MRLLLALRALFFVLLLPGTVAGYIPFSILRAGNLLRVPDLGLASVCAAVFAITGALVLLRCVWDFFAAGKGTLAPIDPPRFLVVRGLYRFTRNPMYNGVIALILAEAWLFRSIGLAEYAVLVLILFHLFVVLYPRVTVRGVVSGLPACRSPLGLHDSAVSREHREHRLTCRCSWSLGFKPITTTREGTKCRS